MPKSKTLFSLPMSKWSIVLIGAVLIVGALLGLGLAGVGAASSGSARQASASSLQRPKSVMSMLRPVEAVGRSEQSAHSAQTRRRAGASSSSASCSSWCTPRDEPALDADAADARQIAGAQYYAGEAVDTDADRVTLYLANARSPSSTSSNQLTPAFT
jgi:hypothetical protein